VAQPDSNSDSDAELPPAPSAPDARDAPDATPRARLGWWPWVALVVIVAAAVGGLSLGTWLGQQDGSLLVAGETSPGSSGRPTIVVVAPSPAVSPVRSPVVIGATGSPTADREYVVASGDTLRTIALQLYGDAALWQRVYQANRDTIGNDPDALQPGMRLRIPSS
jgi:nucleoid-associated protein YgaU